MQRKDVRPAVRHVLIVGAGIAGLSSARALQKQGIPYDIIDAQADVGGLWLSGYHDLRAQGPWYMMAHPEFEMPDGNKRFGPFEFPSGQVLCDYLGAFVDHFGLRDRLRCNTRLVQLERAARATQDGSGGNGRKPIVYDTDYVIMASGNFSSPSIPHHYKDMDRFGGEIIPARMLHDAALLKGKRVLVVGGGKSSQDMCMVAADAGASKAVNLLRRAHWPVPERILGVLPFIFISHTRLAQWLAPRFYDQAPLPWPLEALKNFAWRHWWVGAANAIKLTLGLQGALMAEPDQDPLADQYTGGLAGNPRFYRMVNSERVQAIKGVGDVERFTVDGVVTRITTELGPFDAVVAATGYARSYAYLPADELRGLRLQPDGLWLFRSVLPPRVLGLAFVGSNVITFSDWLTSALQSEWLARVLAGKMLLPSTEGQEADVAALQAWKRSFAEPGQKLGASLQLHFTDYNDQLISDMGLSTRRRGYNLFAETFLPLLPAHYRPVFEASLPQEQGTTKPSLPSKLTVRRPSAAHVNGATLQKIQHSYGGSAVHNKHSANLVVTSGPAPI